MSSFKRSRQLCLWRWRQRTAKPLNMTSIVNVLASGRVEVLLKLLYGSCYTTGPRHCELRWNLYNMPGNVISDITLNRKKKPNSYPKGIPMVYHSMEFLRRTKKPENSSKEIFSHFNNHKECSRVTDFPTSRW